MRILLNTPPFQDLPIYRPDQAWQAASNWPCSWVKPPADWKTPWVAAFRCQFTLTQATTDRLHITADERYELYLDGNLLGRGSERGDKSHWFYETYTLELTAGFHTLVARVWALGSLAPWAQISINSGFLCTPETPTLISLIATGAANWEIKKLADIVFLDMASATGTGMGGGPSERVTTLQTSRGWDRGEGAGWNPVDIGLLGHHGYHSTQPVHWLTPAQLPPQIMGVWKRFRLLSYHPTSQYLDTQWNAFLHEGKPLTIPAGCTYSVIIDLEDYVCAYPELKWSGGGKLSLGWAEALHDPLTKKKIRTTDLKNAHFQGPRDEVIAESSGHWQSLWWRCGRFICLEVETAQETLVLESFSLQETRYPLELESRWKVPDTLLQKVFSLCLRTLQMCAHETYMDCPYYEQLMYVGDTRLQCLLTYALSKDTRLPRKALELFDSSRRNPTGHVAAAHPNHGGQLIPPYELWWVAMVYDFALWRGDADFVHARLPGVRAVLDQFALRVDSEGILHGAEGWNFLDWVFPGGVPLGGLPAEKNSSLQAQWVMVLTQAALLETYAGEPEMAALYRRKSQNAAQALIRIFWDESRGLIADDAAHTSYSEHAQCLALLTDVLSSEQQERVWGSLDSGLIPVSSYFAHYLFEACLQHDHSELFFRRLTPWKESLGEGFSTTPEGFGGEARSDCHAWSAHPLFHFLTGVLGIRPASFGFSSVEITPQLGSLPEASGTIPHPLGSIHVHLTKREKHLHAEVELPEGLYGTFRYQGQSAPLVAGKQAMSLNDTRS